MKACSVDFDTPEKEQLVKTVAIIPARGGSKGIPRKNLIPFCGKPLVAWSIIQATATPGIDEVYVTSDSEEILAVAGEYGALSIRRPDNLSGDVATSESAVDHALDQIQGTVSTVFLLQATSPLRKPTDFGKALQQFNDEKLDSLFSGAVLEDFLIWERDEHNRYQSFNYDYTNRGRRQDRKHQYVENGSFYIFKPSVFIHELNRLGGVIGVYLMDFWQSFEIDSSEDVGYIEYIFEKKLRDSYC